MVSTCRTIVLTERSVCFSVNIDLSIIDHQTDHYLSRYLININPHKHTQAGLLYDDVTVKVFTQMSFIETLELYLVENWFQVNIYRIKISLCTKYKFHHVTKQNESNK